MKPELSYQLKPNKQYNVEILVANKYRKTELLTFVNNDFVNGLGLVSVFERQPNLVTKNSKKQLRIFSQFIINAV